MEETEPEQSPDHAVNQDPRPKTQTRTAVQVRETLKLIKCIDPGSIHLISERIHPLCSSGNMERVYGN